MNINLNLEDDNRPYVLVDVCDEKYRGLLDSGAVASVMNKGVYEYLLNRDYKLYACNIAITTVDGTMHMALGYMKVDYELRGIRRKIPTLVVEKLKATLVLGIDFWDAYGIKPCFVREVFGTKVYSSIEEEEAERKMSSGVNEIFSVEIYKPTGEREKQEELQTVFSSTPSDEVSDITPPKCINVEEPHELVESERNRLKEVVDKMPFCDPNGELNKTWLKEARIDTGDAAPIRCKVRMIPPGKLAKVLAEIDRLEKRGIIRKVESSEWLHPMIAVPKRTEQLRICIDA